MNDTDLQPIVLQRYYDLRSRGLFQWCEVPDDHFPPVESYGQLARICSQLAEENLIDWRPTLGGDGEPVAGVGQIKARGVRVIEGKEESPIAFTINHNNIHNPTNVQLGNHNSISTVINVEKFNAAIEHSSFSQVEKAQAKSALSKFLEHPVIAAIAGGLASAVKAN
ncbi:MAG: hypothetical protein ABI042_16770 [Verrucomicrobiota bacterium]